MNKTLRFLTAFAVLATTSLFAEISETLPTPDDDAGFVSIFNGKDLTGWEGLSEFWSVKDGAITGQTTEGHIPKENTFLVWKGGQPSDFEIHCQFRLVANNKEGFANSGIQYRSKVLKPDYFVVGGYQADMENGATYSGILYEEKGRGILAKRGDMVVIAPDGKKEVVGKTGDSDAIEKAIKKGDWNDYVVIAKGNHLMHFINGNQTIDVVDQQADKAAKSGVIALQIHRGQPMLVQFKNFKIKQFSSASTEGTKKIAFIAGKPSHGPGDHEYRAGFLLLQKCLESVPGVTSVVYSNNWPTDSHALDDAAAIVMFTDGKEGQPALQDDHLKYLGELMKRGVGFGCIHYAVEPTREKGEKEFIDWMGGAFEVFKSVNPFWTANFTKFPNHPVTRGVQPFSINDEWYFNMRFRPNMEGVTPILTDVPPPDTMSRPDGDHSGNPEVRKMVEDKVPQHVMWVAERPDGGRGFGFTGGHRHTNWGNDNFRKVVLNAIVWIAKVEVPENGVQSSVTADELKQNLDPKGGKKKSKTAKR
jgi:type 1 glutamine amidotransferase